MEMRTIGTILKKRIKEMGYTQDEFADEVGIGLSTLRKYISGKNAYSYEVLDMFSEKLKCSYNYLLGKSKSPQDEFCNAVELTRLSEEALEKIHKYASCYDTDFEGRRYIKCLDMLICKDGAFKNICDFLIANKAMNEIYNLMLNAFNGSLNTFPTIKNLGIENDYKLNAESVMMIYIVSELKNLKAEMTPEFIEEIKALDLKNNSLNACQKLQELYPTQSEKPVCTEG